MKKDKLDELSKKFEQISQMFLLKELLIEDIQECDSIEDYINSINNLVKVFYQPIIGMVDGALTCTKKNAPDPDLARRTCEKLGLYIYQTIKELFLKLLKNYDIQPIEMKMETWGKKTLLDILDDLEYIKQIDKKVRVKVPIELPVKLVYDRIAFFIPTSEKLIHFQIVNDGKPTEYFAEETDFPRYRWVERAFKGECKEIGKFTIKNPFTEGIKDLKGKEDE